MKKIFLLLLSVVSLCAATFSFAITDKEVCEGNGIDYQQAQMFISDLRNILKADDKAKLANMIEYPVRVNRTSKSGKIASTYIKTKDAFMKQYASLFTAKTKAGLAKGDVFCHDEGASVGGFVWFKTSKDGSKIFSINPA